MTPGPRQGEPAATPTPGAPLGATPVEPPPVLGTWPRIYAVVIAGLVVMILICGWLSGLGR